LNSKCINVSNAIVENISNTSLLLKRPKGQHRPVVLPARGSAGRTTHSRADRWLPCPSYPPPNPKRPRRPNCTAATPPRLLPTSAHASSHPQPSMPPLLPHPLLTSPFGYPVGRCSSSYAAAADPVRPILPGFLPEMQLSSTGATAIAYTRGTGVERLRRGEAGRGERQRPALQRGAWAVVTRVKLHRSEASQAPLPPGRRHQGVGGGEAGGPPASRQPRPRRAATCGAPRAYVAAAAGLTTGRPTRRRRRPHSTGLPPRPFCLPHCVPSSAPCCSGYTSTKVRLVRVFMGCTTDCLATCQYFIKNNCIVPIIY
jgi:hypothetical protein